MKFLREITNQRDLETHILIDSELFIEQVLLNEATEEARKQNKHLDHVEDLVLRDGPEGFDNVFNALSQTHEFLAHGKRRKGFRITTKYDGSPAVVWGRDPENGKFFVGTKSVFNKMPKVNFTPADIDKNHSNSPRLAEKLKLLLKELPKTMGPKGGIYQGDLMYTSDDVSSDEGHLSFSPNTLTYKAAKNSPEGRRILKSKVGIVPHTWYTMNNAGQLQAHFDIDMNQFKKTDDVYMIDPTIKSGNFKYDTADQKSVIYAIKRAHNIHRELVTSGGYEKFEAHNALLVAYMNDVVRSKLTPSIQGYINYLTGRFKRKTDSVKLAGTKDRIKAELDKEVQNIIANKDTFEKVFALHKHIATAKTTMINVLNQNSPFEEYILGEKSQPEGFVATVNDRPVKLVDRAHFSSANFEWNTKVNPEDNPVVMAWGRFNPPTVGHGRMIDKGADIARRIGAKQITVTTDTHDHDKNPLPAGTKLKWLKTMFPGQNVSVASKQAHTLIAQLQQLHLNGVKDLTIIAGSDRIPEYQRILAKYNGPEANKLFNFKRARVISGGDRDPDSEGVAGMSASKMRDAAKKDDWQTFRSGVPTTVKDDTAKEMFHTLRAELGVVKIGSNTNGHALSIYAKRQDKIGVEARAEIDKRKRLGTWHGRS